MKAFYDQSGGSKREDYDAVAVRDKGKGGKQYNAKMGKSSSGPRTTNRPRPATTTKAAGTTGAKPLPPKVKPLRERGSNPVVQPKQDDGKDKALIAELEATNTELLTKTEELTARVGDLEEAMIETEKERDFYFGKIGAIPNH